MNKIKTLTKAVVLSLTLSTANASDISSITEQQLMIGLGTMLYYDENCGGLTTAGRQSLNKLMGTLGMDIRKLKYYTLVNVGYTYGRNAGCGALREAVVNSGYAEHLKESENK
jgi:hypothetical protein